MAGRILTLGTGRIGSGVDFSSFADAAAKAVAGDVIRVLPGTYVTGACSIAAGVKVVGVGRDCCILQTTVDVNGASAFSCGHLTSFRNVWIRGNPSGGLVQIHLLDFGDADPTQYILLDNVRFDRGGGVQYSQIHAPVFAHRCWFGVLASSPPAIGIETAESRLTSCMLSSSNYLFYVAGPTGRVSIQNSLILNGFVIRSMTTNGAIVNLTGNIISNGTNLLILNTYTATVTLSGNVLGEIVGGRVVIGNAIASLYYGGGNVKYDTAASDHESTSVLRSHEQFFTDTDTSSAQVVWPWATYHEFAISSGVANYATLGSWSQLGAISKLIKVTGGYEARYPVSIQANTSPVPDDTFDLPTLVGPPSSYIIRENYGNVLLSHASTPGIWRVYGSSRPTKANIQGDIQTLGLMQRGSATPDGTTGLKGEGLLGTITSSGDTATFGLGANGGYLTLTEAAAVGARSYVTTASPTGPFSGSANWDLCVRLSMLTYGGSERTVVGLWDKTGRSATDALDSNDPDGPHILVQYRPGSGSLWFAVRDNTVAMGGTQSTVTFSGSDSNNMILVIRKRGTSFFATLYGTSGDVYITGRTISKPTFLATSSLCYIAGGCNTDGSAGRGSRHWYAHAHQFPSTLVSL